MHCLRNPRWHRHPHWTTAAALSLLVFASSGCSAISQLNPLRPDEVVLPTAELAPDQASVSVQVAPEGGEPQRGRVPLRSGMLVGDLLSESSLNKRFGDMQIMILRRLPDGKRIKLDIQYDRAKHRVEPSFNYALLPNDLVLIEEISSTVLDDVLDTLGDPLVRRYRGR